ncbi:MAG: DciA family protein [Acinetobacter sp.]|nr:DciA family protein [Acinetobacter sp.]
MSQPIQIFQKNNQSQRMSNFSVLLTQVRYWQNLSKQIQHLLPQPEEWQIVCYQNGILTIAGKNQAMVNQLNYLRSQYVAQLAKLAPFQQLEKIQATLSTSKQTPPAPPTPTLKPLSDQTKERLYSLAECTSHTNLQAALIKLANTGRER